MEDRILVTRSSMPDYEEYIQAIRPLWDSHWLTNMGCYHRQLEEALQAFLQVPFVSLMVNGHMALELAIQAMGFPRGAEVITTPFTFISTTHAIVRNGLKPVFCDVKPSDGTMDEDKIVDLITERTVAIIPVHVYGNVCNVDAISRIADAYGLKVIYDAAHAFGVTYKGRGIGSFGHACVFSFHATKVFNTIEGGAVSFGDEDLYHRLYDLKNFGIRGEELVCQVGANAKMNEFSAIMGLCNLRHLEENLRLRQERTMAYRQRLRGLPGISFLQGDPQATQNFAYLPVLITGDAPAPRDRLCDLLRSQGIFARKYFHPLTSDMACFKNLYRHAPLDNARLLSSQVLVLPLYPDLPLDAVEQICDIIHSSL